jgi:hypothetical protein
MAHAKSVQFHQAPTISFKPLLAIKGYLAILLAAFVEAKAMELKSRKTSGNW